MQHEATKSEFKAKALELFRQVESSGEVLVITDRGHPTIEVRRFRSDKRTPLEKLHGSIVEYHDPEEPIADDNWEQLS